MDALQLFYMRHARAIRWAWLTLVTVLAACNAPTDGGGGGGGGGGDGGGGGPGY